MNTHIPVMLNEVLEYLEVKPSGIYVDCTLGEGGHSEAIIQKGGQIIGIEQDEEILDRAKTRLAQEKTIFVHDNFRNIKEILTNSSLIKRVGNSHPIKRGNNSPLIKGVRGLDSPLIKGVRGLFPNYADGILYDLGISSLHFESTTRGFSFRYDAPLDMRLDSRNKIKASDLVNRCTTQELTDIILKYGEEYRANKIALSIVKNRPITTTFELIKAIESTIPKHKRIHPATKVFQALRIAVNQELEVLDESLDGAISVLKEGGRLVVISFHSLEDRIVKHKFRNWQKQGLVKIMTKKPIRPAYQEIKANPRAQSAKLRAVEKIKE
ncbi:MAG: 16S rRNA (cytosine(1402)-N(4))-methyltransferase RsmH [bacterium]|nr:16S rRNA (cytosine(1402)-N(4))-methyltransferase RsmH [bacterium]